MFIPSVQMFQLAIKSSRLRIRAVTKYSISMEHYNYFTPLIPWLTWWHGNVWVSLWINPPPPGGGGGGVLAEGKGKIQGHMAEQIKHGVAIARNAEYGQLLSKLLIWNPFVSCHFLSQKMAIVFCFHCFHWPVWACRLIQTVTRHCKYLTWNDL